MDLIGTLKKVRPMKHETDVCIAGAGPAGMILGLLLAKAGLRVIVLEHHADFDREYRGEVLMPRFIQTMRQIGLYHFLEKYPHLKLRELEGFYEGQKILKIGFGDIAPEAPFAYWMPQPVLLGALLDRAKEFKNFELWFGSRVDTVIRENGRVTGVHITRGGEKGEVRAKVTVGADGRFSVLRKRGGFELQKENHTFDIVWFTIPKPEEYDNTVRFFLSPERNYLILPKFPNAIQCGLVIPKDTYGDFVKNGIDSLRAVLLKAHPMMHAFARGLVDFSPFSVLQAKIEYVRKWAQDGLILVGDSAHTCSPAGGIGVSVAAASAVVAADVMIDCFKRNDFSARSLGRVQDQRAEEVLHILDRQKNFSDILLPRTQWQRRLMPYLFFLLSRSGLFRALQRDLLVMRQPLPVRAELSL